MYRILQIMRRLMLCALAGAAACQTSPETSETSSNVNTIDVASAQYGSLQVGSTAPTQYFYIRESTHNLTETISAVTYNGSSSPTACPDFTVDAAIPGYTDLECYDTCGNPAPGTPYTVCPVTQCFPDDYNFDANFHPSIAAAESCTLAFTTSSGIHSITLYGTGLPPPIHVTAAPGSIAFGNVRVNTDSTGVGISVVNSGGATATINSASVGAGYMITAGTTGSHALGAGAGESYTVVCHPTALGAVNGTFTLSSNDPSTPVISIGMTCSGTDSALAVSPSPAVLPTLRVGETEQKTISITNMGAAATSIQAVTITGMTMISAPAPGTPLAANGGATSATIEFDASVKGDVSGTMHIDYDNGKSVDTQITGKAVNTSLSLTPDGDVDFGQVCVGQTKMQMFSLVATDEGSFKLTAASAPDAPFTLAPPTLPATVQGSAANTITFSVAAAPTDNGDATSMIALTTDIPNGEPHVINIHALGLPAGVNGPPQVDLGGNAINQTSIGQHVQISNCTDAAVSIATVGLSGIDASDFAIVDHPDSSTIPPAGSATWLVVLQAHTEGMKSASFDAMTDSGTTTSVPLIGEGLGSGSGGTDGGVDSGKNSYYACSTGRASSVWPIAIALALLLRRRKQR
jgi:hypothetical protein